DGIALVADARVALERLAAAVEGHQVDPEYRELAARLNREWDEEVTRLYALGHEPLPAQSEVIGAVNDAARPADVVVCAAGSMPGDLHKLWRTRDPKGYHVEYGYSCMGYEIAGGLGVDSDNPTAPLLPVDLAANAESLGATVIRCRTMAELRAGLEAAKGEDATVVLAIEVDRYEGVPDYDSWWDVPVAEVSEVESVREARRAYEQARASTW